MCVTVAESRFASVYYSFCGKPIAACISTAVKLCGVSNKPVTAFNRDMEPPEVAVSETLYKIPNIYGKSNVCMPNSMFGMQSIQLVIIYPANGCIRARGRNPWQGW